MKKKSTHTKIKTQGPRKPADYLPASRKQLRDLFDYVAGDESGRCDHTFAQTEAFCKKRHIPEVAMVGWLKYHGIQCDCDLLWNVHNVPFLSIARASHDSEKCRKIGEAFRKFLDKPPVT